GVCRAEWNEGCDVMNKHKLIHPFPSRFFREEQPAPNLVTLIPSRGTWQHMVLLRECDADVDGEGPQTASVSIFVCLFSF
uniref:hypothetical protein n=1 Tax=Halorubellus sp. PRR65 TaxID=3098148 RepID=UPI002B26464A